MSVLFSLGIAVAVVAEQSQLYFASGMRRRLRCWCLPPSPCPLPRFVPDAWRRQWSTYPYPYLLGVLICCLFQILAVPWFRILGDRWCIISYPVLESPLFSQDMVIIQWLAVAGVIILSRVRLRRHYAAYASLYHGFVKEGRYWFSMRMRLIIHGVVFLSALHGSVEGKVLEASHDSICSHYLLCAHVGALVPSVSAAPSAASR